MGYAGKLLRVNLTNGTAKAEKIPESIKRDYIGGRGFGIKYLYDELLPGIDPLSPENKLLLLTGPLCGAGANACSKWLAVTKSPATGTIFRAIGGGSFGPKLKSAGYDFIICEGRAAKPVYININNDEVEILDAAFLWGLDTEKTQEGLKQKHGAKTEIACIGPGGERLVRYAAIVNDRRTASRGGVGAVMGSKNLKAVAVNGTGRIVPHDPEKFKELARKQFDLVKVNPHRQGLFDHGIVAGMKKHYHVRNQSPVRNFRETVFEGIEKLFPEEFDKLKVDNYGCAGCITRCGQFREIKEGPYAGAHTEGPEYEGSAVLGPLIGNSDIGFVIAGDALCDLLGLDVISTCSSIAFACELFEKGIITTKDTDGLDLTWGNHAAFYTLIEKIGKREGFGKLLGEGTKRAAEKIGKGAEKYAMQTKGLELAAYEPRAIKGYALSYAVSNIGGSHMYARPFSEVNIEKDPASEDLWKSQEIVEEQIRIAVWDCATICCFGQTGIHPLGHEPEELRFQLLAAATGFEELADYAHLAKAMERVITLERAFNIREGFGRKDDSLPSRFTDEPMPNSGPYTGQTVRNLDGLIDEYYRLMGYTKEGVPSLEKLKDLGLQDVIESIYR